MADDVTLRVRPAAPIHETVTAGRRVPRGPAANEARQRLAAIKGQAPPAPVMDVRRGWHAFESLSKRPLRESIVVSDRYTALGIPHPDPKTMCKAQCEGTGWVPVYMPEGDTREGGARSALTQEDTALIELWHAAESERPTEDGWHFVKCPACEGTGKRTDEAVLPGRPSNPALISFDNKCFKQDGVDIKYVVTPPPGSTAYPEEYDSKSTADAHAKRIGVIAHRVERPRMRRVSWTCESAPVIGRSDDYRNEPTAPGSMVVKKEDADEAAKKTQQKPADWLDEIKFETHRGAKLPTLVACGSDWLRAGPDAVQAELEERYSNQIESVSFGRKSADGTTEAHVLWVLFRPDVLAHLSKY